MFLVIQRNTNFYNEFYVHLLCGFLVVLNYDEMNCNLIYGIFYNVFWSANFGYILVICNNHESDVGMNGNVKFVEDLKEK
jgi:hypothetical protein